MTEKRVRAIFAAFVYGAVAANVVAMIDRYSPIFSWQSAVVFGGMTVTYFVSMILQRAYD